MGSKPHKPAEFSRHDGGVPDFPKHQLADECLVHFGGSVSFSDPFKALVI